jgi:hypothetical protein
VGQTALYKQKKERKKDGITDTTQRPREAAIAIVHLINSRNQNVALLALAVRHTPKNKTTVVLNKKSKSRGTDKRISFLIYA